MKDAQILHDILTKPTVPLRPHYVWAFGLGRDQAYAEVKRRPDEFILIGEKPTIRCRDAQASWP
jgi:hypothetical protein